MSVSKSYVQSNFNIQNIKTPHISLNNLEQVQNKKKDKNSNDNKKKQITVSGLCTKQTRMSEIQQYSKT